MTKIPFLLSCLASLVSSQTTIVDLSQTWTTGALYNKNKAYCTIQAALNPDSTLGYVVIQQGEIVAEGYGCNADPTGLYEAWSTTKSWSTFFIGVLVEQGKLEITETLGDIFADDGDWFGVTGQADKQAVTVLELLTMSSGLVDNDTGCDPINQGQTTLQEVLNDVNYDASQKGQFNYIGRTHILARIIERRSGETPRQFATSAGIFSKLNMADDLFDWTTFGGVEGSAYGLLTHPRVQAKLGQLYLQGGLAAAGDQLVPNSWVTASVQSYVDNSFANDGFTGYGYQWYPHDSADGAAAAFGANGQIIYFSPASDTTIAIMGEGCTGQQVNQEFLRTILDNLDDLSVEQAECDQTFSYWNYFRQHPAQLLLGRVEQISNALRGRKVPSSPFQGV